MRTCLRVESVGPVGVESESAERRPFGLERERERGSITSPERFFPPWLEARVGRDIISRAELASTNCDARWPSPRGGVGPANVDSIEISILESCVRNLPDPPRRTPFSITDPGHPRPGFGIWPAPVRSPLWRERAPRCSD